MTEIEASKDALDEARKYVELYKTAINNDYIWITSCEHTYSNP